jgi:peptidyl-prolyl cis-trans isomerase SurA
MRTWAVALLLMATTVTAGADTDWVTVDRVVAVVNRDIVLASEVAERLGPFAAELDAIKDAGRRARRRAELRSEVIREMVDNLLAQQQAASVGITAEDSEIDAAIGEIKAANKLDDAGLESALKAAGYTMAKYRIELKRQMIRLKAVNVFAGPRIQITDADVKKAYDDRKAANPSGTGTFDAIKAELRQELYVRATEAEMTKVLAEWHATAYIDVRAP